VQINRFKAVVFSIGGTAAQFKSDSAGIVKATDATDEEVAYATRWLANYGKKAKAVKPAAKK
jgi:hypothetical protein